MFREANCDLCGDCLDLCKNIDFGDKENASREFEKLIKGEKVDWLNDCITCMACDEYCAKDANPFSLILQRLEEDGNFTDPQVRQDMAARFLAKKDPGPVQPKRWNMSLCVMTGNMPWAPFGQLFENDDITILKGLPYFCNVLFVHMGNESIMKDRMQKMVDNLAASGAKEIIFVHEDCYVALNTYAKEYGIELPFKPVHMFEYLKEYLTENQDKIKKLNIKAAYQRPCASRHTAPEVEALLNDIFDLIGVERATRKYEGIDALCCGVEVAGPGLKLFPRGKNYEPFQDKNIQDAKDNGAEAMVYLCPMCFKTLSPKARAAGLKNYMVSDICRLALGEELPADKPE